MHTIITINRAASLAAGVTLSLIAMIGTSHAVEATAAQRAACTPDALRLCSGDIPNVSAVTACMIRNKPNLSTACRSVFGK